MKEAFEKIFSGKEWSEREWDDVAYGKTQPGIKILVRNKLWKEKDLG